MILGYEFLKLNEIIIDTKHKVLKKVEGNGIIEFHLGCNGEVKTRRLYGVDVTAEENAKLEKENKTIVKVGWNGSEF